MIDLALLKPIRPLIVEDEKESLASLFSLCHDVFELLYTARNGEEGMYNYYKYEPDIIITDLQMPLMSGFRMIEKIRLENIGIPIIITSAHSQQEHQERAKKLGVSEYLVKPFDIDDLFEKIYYAHSNRKF